MEPDFRADLHCHSLCSDGTDPPAALLQKAKEANLRGLSITDHDTIAAYTPDLFALAASLEIELLPGIEISSEMEENTVHVLGYGFDLESLDLHAFLEQMQGRRIERNRAILGKLRARKMPIEEEELIQFAKGAEKKKSVGRPHIAELMVQKGYVATRQEAFEHYLREGGLCYAPGFKITPRDAIAQIHAAQGKAVLAHPHFLKAGSFLRSLLSRPFDGIECYYGNLHKSFEERWLEIAKKKSWIATGGSDYHGALKPYLSLGCSWVCKKTFESLKCTKS